MIRTQILTVFILASSFFAQADVNKKNEEKKTTSVNVLAPDQATKKEHSFEDLLVQGKYHFSDEAVVTVEEDKVLDALLGMRTHFKDRIEDSVGRY